MLFETREINFLFVFTKLFIFEMVFSSSRFSIKCIAFAISILFKISLTPFFLYHHDIINRNQRVFVQVKPRRKRNVYNNIGVFLALYNQKYFKRVNILLLIFLNTSISLLLNALKSSIMLKKLYVSGIFSIDKSYKSKFIAVLTSGLFFIISV